MKTFLRYQFPALLWVVVIYLLSAVPDLQFNLKSAPGLGKIEHAFVYFMLCGLARRAFVHQYLLFVLRKSSLLGAFIFTVVFSLLEEYHQNFVPGHETNPYNLLANVGGALLFVALFWLVRRDDERD